VKNSKTLIRACRILRAKVRFAQASFGDIHECDEVTKKIKDQTRLYTESWVVPLIDMIERGDMARLNRRLSGMNECEHAIDTDYDGNKKDDL